MLHAATCPPPLPHFPPHPPRHVPSLPPLYLIIPPSPALPSHTIISTLLNPSFPLLHSCILCVTPLPCKSIPQQHPIPPQLYPFFTRNPFSLRSLRFPHLGFFATFHCKVGLPHSALRSHMSEHVPGCVLGEARVEGACPRNLTRCACSRETPPLSLVLCLSTHAFTRASKRDADAGKTKMESRNVLTVLPSTAHTPARASTCTHLRAREHPLTHTCTCARTPNKQRDQSGMVKSWRQRGTCEQYLDPGPPRDQQAPELHVLFKNAAGEVRNGRHQPQRLPDDCLQVRKLQPPLPRSHVIACIIDPST